MWVIPTTDGRDSQDILGRLWLLLAVCLGTLVLSSAGLLLVRAAGMSDYPLKAVFPVLPTILYKTHFGWLWLVRIVALLALCIGWFMGRKRLDSHAVPAFMLIAAGVIAFTRSASGHAADEGDFRLPELMDWLHLMAASFWGGGLLVLSTSIIPISVKRAEREPSLIAHIIRRFSFLAGIALGVIVITAMYNAWLEVGSLEALFKTQYGWTIIAKLLLLSGLVVLGALNRYVAIPLLQQGAGESVIRRGFLYNLLTLRWRRASIARDKRDMTRAACRFLRNVRLEAVLIVGALLCAALLLNEVPARHLPHADGHSIERAEAK